MAVENPLIAFSGFHPDYKELVRYFKENKVYTLQIESNLACEQGCLYCYASSEYDIQKELDTKTIKSVLESASELEIKAVDWLGGDPLLRKDWHELMKHSIELGLKNNIWTSGIPLADMDTAIRSVEVSEGGFISVHLDTLDEGLYKKLHKGDPKKNINAIIIGVDNILSMGKCPDAVFNCITFVKSLAGEDVEQTIRYFFEEKGIRTCLTQMCKAGSALEHPEWAPSLEEIKDAVRTRDSINYPSSSESMSTMDANKFYCGGAICISIDGDVTPCSVIRKGFGNILQESLDTIIEKNKDVLLYTELRDVRNLPGNCGACHNNSVCWGCRASAFYEAGDILAEDPKCWLGKNHKLQKVV